MPGQMGGKRVTTQNLKVVQVRADENLILVKGSIPGANGGIVVIKEALKKK
jgi:large subunit ribosomal protein L3